MKHLLIFFNIVGLNFLTDYFTEGDDSSRLPNIVWFMSEDNSPFIGAYGDSLAVTPNLDRLAKQGITFQNAFANAPVCAPSRSSIITGVLPTSIGTEHMRCKVEMDSSIVYFPALLRENGYFTTLRFKKDYNASCPKNVWDKDDFWDINESLEGRKEKQPFFIFYNTWISHETRLHPQKDRYKYFRDSFEYIDSTEVEGWISNLTHIQPEQVKIPKYLPDIPEVRNDFASYYEFMAMMDLEYKYVMDYLEKIGELDNTIIIYSSDHGGVQGRSKRFTFESGLKIPLIIYIPPKFRGKELKNIEQQLVSLIDMPATILSMGGVNPPKSYQGHDIFGKQEDRYSYGFRGRMDESLDLVRSLRDKQYRYVRNFYPQHPNGIHINFLWKAEGVKAWEKAFNNQQTDEFSSAFFEPRTIEELYDCDADPENIHNLAADPSFKRILNRFRKALKQEMERTNDIGFIPEADFYAHCQKQKIPYTLYAKTQPMKVIRAAAWDATSTDDFSVLSKLMQSEVDAVRFWGVNGCMLQKKLPPHIVDQLKDMLDDTNAAVQASTAEVLYTHGFTADALAKIEQLLQHQNPFVALRVMNCIEVNQINNASIKKVIQSLKLYDKQEYGGEYINNKINFLRGNSIGTK
ncbi:sulfatase [Persicobacter diffluens]